MGILVRGRLTTLRPAGAGDVERLVAWHADPEVSRYWDDETFTHAEMDERLARGDVEAWIVEEDGEPIGYLQVHAEGLDMFLVPAARGRGLGPEAARAMTEYLIREHGRERVGTTSRLPGRLRDSGRPVRGRARATRRSPRSGRPRGGAYPWPVLS